MRPPQGPNIALTCETLGRADRTGDVAEGPRREFFYFSDNADLMAVRYNAWKLNFKTIVGNLFTGKEDSTNVAVVTNLRQDPWERYQTEGMLYGRWWGEPRPSCGRGICPGWMWLCPKPTTQMAAENNKDEVSRCCERWTHVMPPAPPPPPHRDPNHG